MGRQVTACVAERPGSLRLVKFDMPEIGLGDALLRVESAGICGTDVKIVDGHYAGKVGWPVILGHEICGSIAALSDEAASRWNVVQGTRVVVDSFLVCGYCEECRSGRGRYCSELGDYGVAMSASTPPHLWGGFAEYMFLTEASQVYVLPQDMPADIGVLTPAVLANAIRWCCDVGKVSFGSSVLVAGPGPIGLACVAASRRAGAARVDLVGLATDQARLSLAKEFGADEIVVLDDELRAIGRASLRSEGYDVVVDVSGSATSMAHSVGAARIGGTLVIGGLAGKMSTIDTDLVALRELSIRGVFSHDPASVRRAIEWARLGELPFKKLVSHRVPLAEVDAGLDLLRSHDPSVVKVLVVP